MHIASSFLLKNIPGGKGKNSLQFNHQSFLSYVQCPHNNSSQVLLVVAQQGFELSKLKIMYISERVKLCYILMQEQVHSQQLRQH
jgi:hypothetical protein